MGGAEIPENLKAEAEEYRHQLIDVLSTFDENILEKYVGDEEITVDDLQSAIRAGTIANEIVPVLNGTAFKNKGVQPLLDAIVAYLPSPLDLPPVTGLSLKGNEEIERKPVRRRAVRALAFKIMSDPHVGKLTYFRVYSGTLEKGSQVVNTTTGSKERIGRILQMHANHREDVDAVLTGDIAAGIGLKNTRTGDTLTTPGSEITLEQLVFPEPVIHVAVEPKTKVDQEKMGKALQTLSEEDPTFQVRTDEDTGQTVISGMGELHLEVIVDRMLREFRVDATVGKPQVAYRETITQTVEKVTYTHKKQTGGSASSPRSPSRWSPRPGRRLRVRRQDHRRPRPEGVHPRGRRRHPAVAGRGRAGRLPTVDIRATLTDGKYHDVDSSEMAFKIAGSMVFKEAARKAKPVLLEPIMSVEVVTPEDYMGDVIGDLNSRRGRVGGMDQRGNSQVIRAQVPLSEMFGYATDLRSRTQGRATYTMQFHSYQQTPASVQEEIVARVRGE